MDFSTISILVSSCVAATQIWSFFELRSARIQASRNQFARADEVSKNQKTSEELDKKLISRIIMLEKQLAIISERIDNDIRGTEKLMDKIEEKLDRIESKNYGRNS